MRFLTSVTAALAVAILPAVFGAASASAAIMVTPYGPDRPPPNDCAGEFGASFDKCVDPDGSPVIAKWDVDKNKWEINSAFSNVKSDMFTVSFNSGSSGTWSYAACALCVRVTSWVAKDGNGFNWFHTSPKEAVSSGAWYTLGKGLSHITFYDSAPPPVQPPSPVPLPASALVLMLGLGGLGALRSIRRMAA